MNLRTLWAVLAVMLPVLAALLAPLPATDLTYHLRAGAEILDTGRIPSVDSWTFTAAGEPWFDQQWGSQVVLAAVYRLAGWTGLVAFRAVLVGAVFALVFELCRRRGVGLRTAAWLALAAFLVAAPALALRPQLLGMVLFAATLLLVLDRHAHPRRLWLAPVLALVWANVHGSFFLAPVVLGLAWLADVAEGGQLASTVGRPNARHHALLVAAAAAVAACVTPFGPAVWVYAVALGSNPEVSRRITEWQPTSLRDVPGIVFHGSALLVAAFLARRGRATPWPTLAWLGVFFVIGAYAARGIAWWSLAAVAAIAPLLGPVLGAETARTDPPTIRRANGLIAVGLVIVVIALLPLWRPVDPNLGAPEGVLTQAPSRLTRELRAIAGQGDRLFNEQRWGSWFEFALPDVPVAIDSRIELFPASVWDDYETVLAGRPGWQEALDAWGVTVIAVDAAGGDSFVGRLADVGWVRHDVAGEGTIMTRGDRH